MTMKIPRLLWAIGLTLPLAFPAIADEATPATKNVLTNGGFEKWQTVSAEEKAKPDSVLKEGRIAEGYWFNSEAYERGQDPKFPIKVTISNDETVKHGGAGSVRIDNLMPTDIGSVVLQPVSIEPNTRYLLRVWMKGDKIVLDEKTGTGVAVWTNVGPTTDFWGKMKNDLFMPEKKSGTFDWTPFEIKFDAPADPSQAMLSFQLRRASGTVWFDAVELTPIGKIEPIPTF